MTVTRRTAVGLGADGQRKADLGILRRDDNFGASAQFAAIHIWLAA
jgi:hypothetical protein